MLNRIILTPRPLYVYILLVLITLVSAISILPLDAKEPNADSSIFLYAGQQILNGDTLYKDLWDNKGPLLYYINALAVLISPASLSGLYIVELVLLFVTVLLGYLVIEKAFGRISAIFASLVWPLTLFYMHDYGGNFTEEYSLPLSFAALYLFLRSRGSRSNLIYIFFIGVTFSLAILLRPNNAGMEVSIALLILVSGIANRRFYALLKEVSAYALGSILVLAAVLPYFYRIGALDDFYDAFIRYNSVYSHVPLKDRVVSLMTGLRLISLTGLPLVVTVSWIVGVFALISKRGMDEYQRALISVGVIGLPLELILSSMSGLRFTHYYLCWLPVFATLTGYFIFEFIRDFSSSNINVFKRSISLTHVWVFGFLVAMSCFALVKIPGRLQKFISTSIRENTVLEAIKDSVSNEKYLLMWGVSPYYNYATGVKSPTRFFHQLPLYFCSYTTDEMIEEFLDDIKQKTPLIVDTSATDSFLPPIDKEERKKWKYVDFTERKYQPCAMRPKMEEVFDYIYSNYKLINTTERYKWKIYQYAYK